MHILAELLGNVDGLINGFVEGVFRQISPFVANLWATMMAVLVAFYGYSCIATGHINTQIMVMTVIKMVIIFAIATQWNHFLLFVYNMATVFPAEVANEILVSQGTDSNAQQNGIMAFVDRGLKAASKMFKSASWYEVSKVIFSASVYFITIAFAAAAGFLLVLAKLAVALILAVGPIFILLLMFKDSKALFEGWLRTLMNYALVPLFVFTLLALLSSILGHYMTELETAIEQNRNIITPVSGYMMCCIIAILLISQVMNITGGITGGYSLSTMGAGRGAARRVKMTSGAAGRGMRNAYSRIRGRGAA